MIFWITLPCIGSDRDESIPWSLRLGLRPGDETRSAFRTGRLSHDPQLGKERRYPGVCELGASIWSEELHRTVVPLVKIDFQQSPQVFAHQF